jgi:tRNA-splicing ligase RtcB
MPDGHSGYGFPIGGVAAFDVNEGGVISPGGIGFDINCGMRLVLTNLTIEDVKPHLRALVDKLFRRVPAGVGSRGFVRLSKEEFRDKVAMEGSRWAVDKGYGWKEDLDRTELGGKARWADSDAVSWKAIERGFNQIGTLGSGNHYLEIQWVRPEHIFNADLAKKWGLFPDQIVVMFHCGSRGFGHQVATDYLMQFLSVMESKYGIKILDRELACAPFHSPEGQNYYKAMGCAVNMSFANRQVILHRVREVFAEEFGRSSEELGMHMVFDIAHNRGTFEKHEVDGKVKELIVHRKGATGCYHPGREETPELYRKDGSPVIIGGSMETGSYLLVGGPNAAETFCSTAHGSGRTMSRTRAKHMVNGRELIRKLEERGIYIKSVSYPGVAEEAGFAYKNIDDVVEATALAGISLPVVKLVPIGNVKG